MNTTSRRHALLGLGAGLVSACASPPRVAAAAPPPVGPSAPPSGPPGANAIVPLPFDPSKLRGLSERLLTSHHQKNYAGAVKNLNLVEAEIAKLPADAPGFVVSALRGKELVFRNSKALHEAYFGNLGGDGKRAGAIDAALAAAFGSSSAWEEAFRAAAKGLAGGSGWVVLACALDSEALRIAAAADHAQALSGAVPLLVLDMYEHSYAMDHGADAARYIDAFLDNVRWDEVDRRFSRATKAARAMRG